MKMMIMESKNSLPCAEQPILNVVVCVCFFKALLGVSEKVAVYQKGINHIRHPQKN